VFIAEVPELPGCAADGAIYQEAIANAELVIEEWIETAKGLGRPVPEPRGRLIYA
jgi:predicted RNase H-like HicB family nuclease